jgi:hypothetical protein
LAKVKSIAGFIWVWLTHLILYSTGSSRVDILWSEASNWLNIENYVVDFHDPVGHTAKIIQ